MSGILFVSSHNTGHGHKSITEALREHLVRLAPNVSIEEVDGFALSGKFSEKMSKMYNVVAVSIPLFWKYYYELGNIFPSVANFFTARSMDKAFTAVVRKIKPDLIVSVHPCYVTSVEDILEKIGYNIPVVSLVADLDNVTRMWADRRSYCTICPTDNAKYGIMKYGIPEEKIRITGFPIRDRFNHFIPEKGISYYKRISDKQRLTFLIMNGSQGRRIVTRMAKELLDNFDCRVIILAGNNELIKNAARQALESYGDRVEVCGFIKNVEQYMKDADILILRASPNVLMEAVNLCKPVIITGALTGQEEKNPEFAAANKLGVVCEDVGRLAETVRELLASEGKRLDEIYEGQIRYRQPEAAREIAEFLLEAAGKNARRGRD